MWWVLKGKAGEAFANVCRLNVLLLYKRYCMRLFLISHLCLEVCILAICVLMCTCMCVAVSAVCVHMRNYGNCVY